MIRHPRPGQVVQAHYARRYAAAMPHHGRIGAVRIVGRGPGPPQPRNHAVEFSDGAVAVIPSGNLRPPAARHPPRKESTR